MSKIKNLTDSDFHLAVDNAEIAMVDFGAEWCRPCKMLEPIMNQISEEVSHSVFKVDVDEGSGLAQEFKIMSVPTVIVFRNGQIHKRFSGLTSKENLLKLFE
jgi:thioredoxin 1